MIRRAGPVATGWLAVLCIIALAAEPAAAHGGAADEDADATNYRTRVLDVSPSVDGLQVRAIDAGSRLELLNDTGREVIVLGYEGEPYLRLVNGAVFENVRSPAVYLNAERYATGALPPHADADAAPEWRRVGDGRVARWHDHRAHWMSPEPPPAVAANRDAEVVIFDAWQVPLLVGGDAVVVTGDLTWVPGPAAWPAAFLAVGGGVAGWVLGHSRWWRHVIVVLLVVVAAVSTAQAAGAWAATSESTLAKLAALPPTVLGLTLAVAAGVMLRRSPRDALLLASGAAVGVGALAGLTNLDWLSSSQLPTALPRTLGWATVAGALTAASLAGAMAASRLPQLVQTPTTRSEGTLPLAGRQAPVPAGLRGHRIALVLGGIAVMALSVWVTQTDDRVDDNTGLATSEPVGIHESLCTALGAAVADDLDVAAATFSDEAHGPLHNLAAAAQDVDRGIAARLLEAKQQVEADLATDPNALADDLARLVPTVRAALGATGQDIPEPCPQEAAS